MAGFLDGGPDHNCVDQRRGAKSMTPASVREEQLRKSNPLFSDRRLKLGTFSTNLSGGCTISTMDGVLKADWPSALTLARLADEMEFEAIVPVGRWRGFGGVTDFNGAGFECFTFAAAVAASTSHPAVFATAIVPTVHPVLAAKQGTTVDHISNGRFALNLVTGWHKSEIEIFGAPMLEHDARYDCAEEWLTVIKRIWEQDEPVNFEGRYYQVKGAFLRPKPVQSPRPVVMCAGASGKGRDFTAKLCDVAFTTFDARHSFEQMRAQVDGYRMLARKEYGREIRVWTVAYVIQGDTDGDAQRLFNHCVHEKGDWEAVSNLAKTLGLYSQSVPLEALNHYKVHLIAGWGGYPLVGTKEKIVDGLQHLANTGLDGVLLSWPRYIDGMRQFQSETLPLLVQAGLR
jgi:FMNH2-dependent dimethyl sulfone monooxygenase